MRVAAALVVMVLPAASAAQSYDAPVRRVDAETLAVMAGRGPSGYQSIFSLSLVGDGRIVIATGMPGALQLAAANGRVLWERRTAGHPLGVAVAAARDRIGVLETGDGVSLVEYRLNDGKRLAQAAIHAKDPESVRLLGWTGKGWAIAVEATASTMSTPGQPLHELRLLEPGADWRRLLSRVDSTPTTVFETATARAFIRPPFAPSSSFGVTRHGDILHAPGTGLFVDVLGEDGQSANRVRLQNDVPPHAPDSIPQFVADWIKRRPRFVPETVMVNVARMGPVGAVALTGALYVAPNGDFLVQRRDLDPAPTVPGDSLAFDIVRGRETVGRLTLPPAAQAIAFDGARIAFSVPADDYLSRGGNPRFRVVVLGWSVARDR